MAVAMLPVGRRGGVAHGQEGPDGGDDVEARVGQGRQHGDGAAGDPGGGLDPGQDQGRADRQGGDAAGQGRGLLNRQAAGLRCDIGQGGRRGHGPDYRSAGRLGQR